VPYLTLLAKDKDEEDTHVRIPAGRPFTIGRGASSSLRIHDNKMSRVHCELSISGGIAIITDLGSMNGTYVDGKRIASTALKDGNRIQVGYTKFIYHSGEIGTADPGPAVQQARSVAPAPRTVSIPKPPPLPTGEPPAAPARRKSAARPAAAKPPPLPAARRPGARKPVPRKGAPPKPARRTSVSARPAPRRTRARRAETSAERPAAAPQERGSPDSETVARLLNIVHEKPSRPLRKGEMICCSCRQPATGKELKSGAATNIHGQVCCPRCIAADPLLGHTVAGYRIDAKLGAGPWSATYKAEQLSMARPVVLRVLRRDAVGDSELVTRFLAAVKRGGQISHPNLVRTFDIGRTESLCYVSGEYIDGDSLAQLLRRKSRLAVGTAADIIRQVAGAVDVAHRRGVLHRDIRPSNIILNDEGIPKLVGLGFAQSIEEAAAAGSFTFPHPADAVCYWAPECVVDPAHASRQADVYSLGAVLYAVLAGHPPFTTSDPVELVKAIRRLRPKPLDAVRNDVPRRLGAVVAKAMAKIPADRYAGCQDLMKDLRGAASRGVL